MHEITFHLPRIYKTEYDLVLEKMKNGTAKPCFATEIMEGSEKKEFSLSQDEKLVTFTTLVEAGSDTSRVSIIQLVAAAATYPEVSDNLYQRSSLYPIFLYISSHILRISWKAY